MLGAVRDGKEWVDLGKVPEDSGDRADDTNSKLYDTKTQCTINEATGKEERIILKITLLLFLSMGRDGRVRRGVTPRFRHGSCGEGVGYHISTK